jgi:hypothetical protein
MISNIEISQMIAAADATFRASNFHNMTPKMIAAEMRASGICRAINAIRAAQSEIYGSRQAAFRSGHIQLGIYDRLMDRADAVWSRYNRAIEAAVVSRA